MSDPIRVGIVGAGANTRAMHLPKLRQLEGVEVVAVCNRSLESGRRVAQEFAIPRVCEHWIEVVEDPDVDAVLIGTWPYLHCPVTLAALEHEKHVLCEARMAMNASEAQTMYEAAQQCPHLVTQVVPSPFTLPWDRTIQELLASGALGQILAVDIFGGGDKFVDYATAMTWRQDADLSGLNTMAMGIWYEGMARWLGHARDVLAMTQTVVRQRPRAGAPGLAPIRVPDHVDVLARLDIGAQAHFRFSAVTGMAPHPGSAFVYGSEGTLRLDTAGGKLYLGRRADSAMREWEVPADKRGAWRVEEEFINAIRGREKVQLTTFAEGVKYMEFTEAVARSAATGQRVTLPLLGV